MKVRGQAIWSIFMQNAHERFGTLEFTKCVKDTTTRVRACMYWLIAELGMEERGTSLWSGLGSEIWTGLAEAFENSL
jgi:hypothetical protein